MKAAGEEEKRIAINKGHVNPSDGIPYITVIGDGGWCKRSYGHGYNASSGVVSTINDFSKTVYIYHYHFCRVFNWRRN